MHTTNYYNTFIEVAEDCPVQSAEIPLLKDGNKSTAYLQFEMMAQNPYKFTSDDLIFAIYADKNNLSSSDQSVEREKFFSKGQPCLRTSPLAKRYGWGIHCNTEAKVAIYPVESTEYKKFTKNSGIKHKKAMRSKRK